MLNLFKRTTTYDPVELLDSKLYIEIPNELTIRMDYLIMKLLSPKSVRLSLNGSSFIMLT